MEKLWTKNFTIITLGSVVSMLGSTVSNFALGLLVFEKTNSPFLYSLFFLVNMLPTVLLPLLIGPYLDRYPRRKVIYGIDYLYGIVFTLITVLAFFEYFNYFLYLFIGFILGILASIYNVAYESFYPELISEGNFSKAYSISSLLWPIANTLMVPLAAWISGSYGLFPLFLFDAVTFFFTASVETQIKVDEKHMQGVSKSIYTKDHFVADFKEGFAYLYKEKALMAITAYFFFMMFSSGVSSALMLPFFKTSPGRDVQQYAFVMSLMSAGRIVGGFAHYFFHYPTEKKYHISLFVYIVVTVLEVCIFILPYQSLIPLMFIYGMLGVTSFNIRVSATQSYVPNEMRGRFNGAFLMITTIGTTVGQLLGGISGEFMDIPTVMIGVMFLGFISVYYCVIRNSKSLKVLYNRKV